LSGDSTVAIDVSRFEANLPIVPVSECGDDKMGRSRTFLRTKFIAGSARAFGDNNHEGRHSLISLPRRS
jgi:hypothetical protein